jgi:hypothetical protein
LARTLDAGSESCIRQVMKDMHCWADAGVDSHLEASSYACAPQGKPLGRFAHLAWYQIMAG